MNQENWNQENLEKENFIKERYTLTIERIKMIVNEETVAEKFRDYFQRTANFILEINQILKRVQEKPVENCTIEELKEENKNIYRDILGENYSKSYADPSYAVSVLGEEIGRLLSFLYTEIRGEIAYVYEEKILYLTICNELFVEIYNCFEGVEEPNYRTLRDIIYWYINDYCDVFVADHIEEKINPECNFAVKIVMNSDLSDLRYFYKYGEYISENEWKTAEYLNALPQEKIDAMAKVYTEGCSLDFDEENAVKKEFEKGQIVNIQYRLGFERVVKKMIENFVEMGVGTTIYRAGVSVFTKNHRKQGYYGAVANKQYEYDHERDYGLFLSKKIVERKLEVMKNTYEQHKNLTAKYAGIAGILLESEKCFETEKKESAITISEKQEQLLDLYREKSYELTSQYIRCEMIPTSIGGEKQVGISGGSQSPI